jgi:hypothetical protein
VCIVYTALVIQLINVELMSWPFVCIVYTALIIQLINVELMSWPFVCFRRFGVAHGT